MSKSAVAKPARTLILLGVALLAALFLHLAAPGDVKMALGDLLGALAHGPSDPKAGFIVWSLRLPRALTCVLVGGILGAVGSAFQALLRNPLADPFVLGVSGGAAVGGSLAVVLGFSTLAIAGFGFVGGMATLALVYALATQRGVVDVSRLILAGVVTGSLLSSLLTLILLAGGKDTNVVLTWLLGDASTANWTKTGLLAVALAIGFPFLAIESRRLNALALGTEAARRLGVDAAALARLVLISGGFMTAAAVGTCGIVGFLGLVAPHLARRLLGVDWRWSLPGSLLLGSGIMVLADLVAQRALPTLLHRTGMELPVGAVTSILGAPTLLALLRKSR